MPLLIFFLDAFHTAFTPSHSHFSFLPAPQADDQKRGGGLIKREDSRVELFSTTDTLCRGARDRNPPKIGAHHVIRRGGQVDTLPQPIPGEKN